MRFSNILTLGLLLSMVLSTACGPRKHGQLAYATFLVLPLSAQEVHMSGSDAELNVPRTSSFTVKACIQDSGLLQPVVDQEFKVVEGPKEYVRKTDSQGCLYWPEKITFNYLSHETYVRMVRRIEAHGLHRGSVPVEFAMNPWKSSGDSLVDLRGRPMDPASVGAEGTIPEANALKPTTSGNHFSLVQEVSLHTYDSRATPAGSTVAAHLTLHPFLTRLAIDSTEVREVLKKGRFKLELFLIEKARTDRSEDDVLLSKSSLVAESEEGVINVVTRFPLSKTPSPMSLIELGFRLTPLSIDGLGSQEAMVVLDQLMLQSTLPVQPLNRPLDTFEFPAPTASSGPMAAPGIRFDSVRVESGGVQAVSSTTGMPKAIGVRITVCLRDALNLRPIIDQPFEVKVAPSGTAAATATGFSAQTSDIQGCLYWQSKMAFDSYATERWFARYLVVRSKRAPYQDIKATFTVYVNPWQSGSLYAWDSRMGPPPSSAPKPAPSPKHGPSRSPSSDSSGVRLQISEMSYSYVGRDLEVDRYLNLTVKRKYQIRLRPMIYRPRSYSTGVATDPIQHGRLGLRALLMAGNQPLSTYSGVVDVDGGVALGEITFAMDSVELPLIQVRNRLVLELYDPEQGSSLGMARVSTPFVASDMSGSLGLSQASSNQAINAAMEPSSDDVRSMVAKGVSATLGKRPSASPTQLLSMMTGLTQLSGTALAQLGLAPAKINSFVRAGAKDPQALARFCGLLIQDSDLLACRTHPDTFFNTTITRHLDQVDSGSIREGASDSFSVTAAAAFAVTTADTVNNSASTSTTHSVYAGAHVDVEGGFKVFGVGAGTAVSTGYRLSHDWTKSHSVDRSEATSHGYSSTLTRPLTVERVELGLSARVRQCASITVRNPLFLPSGYYVCESEASPSEVREAWYFIGQTLPWSSRLLDPNAPEAGLFAKVIRGDKAFAAFRKEIEDSSKAIIFEPDFAAGASSGGPAVGFSRLAPAFADSAIPGVLE